MGIINDFIQIKENIIESKNSKKGFFHRLACKRAKKKLFNTLDKLSVANAPLFTDQILELAQSAYADSISTDKKIVYRDVYDAPLFYLYYYPTPGIYKIELIQEFLKSDNIKSFIIEVSGEQRKMNIEITLIDKSDRKLYHSYAIESESVSTSIKEIKKEMFYCNKILLNIIKEYIFKNLANDERF